MAQTVRRALFCLRQTLNSAAIPYSRTSNAVTPLRSYLGSVYGFSSDAQSFDIDLSNEENKRRFFNRLLYRSKQRGFLELDLVLGRWVEQHIFSMDKTRVKDLVDVLDLLYVSASSRTHSFELPIIDSITENPDLWKWLTGQEQPPEAVNSNSVFSAIRDEVMNNLNSHSAPETRALPGQPWVRGWDDSKKSRDSPIAGNQ